MGTGVALVTPFKSDLSVDAKALCRLVEHCIEGGADYLVALGTTGESVTLAPHEKRLVMQTVSLANAGQLPLVVGVGGNNTRAVVEELREIDIMDYGAILSVSPAYNKPTQEGIYQHFRALDAASPLPMIVYNVPSRTGSNMLPGTTLRLARDCDNIIAIKEAIDDSSQVAQLIAEAPSGFQVISGDDSSSLSTVLTGGAGVISVLGQALPSEFSRMIALGLNGDAESAQAIYRFLLPGMKLAFEEGNPTGVKAILELLGICSSRVRLPLVPASDGLKQRIHKFLVHEHTIEV